MSEQPESGKLQELEKKLEAMGDVNLSPPRNNESQPAAVTPAAESTSATPPSGEAKTREDAGTGNPGEQNQQQQAQPSGQQAVPPEQKPEDQELAELEAIQTPQAEHWRKARELIKRNKAEAERYKAELEQARAAANQQRTNVTPPETPQAESTKKQEESLGATEVISAYINAKLGKFGERSKAIERDALTVMDGYAPSEWLKIRDAAMRGDFGSASEDVLDVVREQLPIANARVYDAQIAQEHEQKTIAEQHRKMQEAHTQSYERACAKYPDMRNEQSPFRKHVEAFKSEFVFRIEDGKITHKGPLFELLKTPNWPEVIVDLAAKSYSAGQQPQTTSSGKQVITIQRPAAEPSGKPSTGVASGSRLAQLEATLASMGTIKL